MRLRRTSSPPKCFGPAGFLLPIVRGEEQNLEIAWPPLVSCPKARALCTTIVIARDLRWACEEVRTLGPRNTSKITSSLPSEFSYGNTYSAPSIDEYLRKRLMPVEGAIPHVQGIEMYGNSIPAGTVGGDLFEYINFQQRYDIDARIQRALKRSRSISSRLRQVRCRVIQWTIMSNG